MKNIIWIISLVYFLQGVCCNKEILSKFHQTVFKLKDVRIQLISFDKNYFNYFEIKAFKYNRTTTAHNSSANMKVDLKDNVEVVVQANKFISNEYRHFPLRFQTNLKSAFDTNAIGLGELKNCGNLTSIYFYKDVTYHICNFVIDETRFPPLLPNGKYKVDLTLLYFNAEIGLIDLFLEVYIPNPFASEIH